MTHAPDASRHVIGIDAGGTKTVCQLADATGRIVAETEGGGANLQSAGELGVEKVLHAVMDEAIGSREIVPSVICLGIAGVDRADDAAVVEAIMRRIGYKARVVVTNDALVALVAGAGDGPGIVIVAGTGSIAYGRNAANRAARAGGWGYVLGDEGSGYWIGRHALRAVVRQADDRGRATALTPLILRHFAVARAQDLVHQVYYRGLRPSEIAAIATYVQQAHEGGDEVANEIIDSAARELAAAAASVAKRLGMNGDTFPFVLSGGIFRAVPWLVEVLTARLHDVAPHATVSTLRKQPAWGSVQIALAELAGGANLPVYVHS
jgi:N-acetylglucosamine kinase-like BadF-type ATPase